MNRPRVALATTVSLAVAGAVWTSALAAGEQPPPAARGDLGVSCYVDAQFIPDAQERQRLRTAPHGARRVSAHALVVNTRSGRRRFADPKPYLEELDRIHWSYCGYVAALHAHLVGLENGSLFTGKLLLEPSGRKLEAGATVLPSPDGKLFLAGSQTNGEYLGRWTLSDLSGRQLWVGVSGVTGSPDIEFGDPVWIANDVLRAPATCNDRRRKAGEATLAREGTTWRWKVDLACQG
jgi:hypothetical protein